MADPKTILEYATSRSVRADQALTAARQRVAAAQADLALAEAEAKTASGDLADLERKAADIREKLAIIVTPADGAALLDELEETIVKLRARQADIVKIQERSALGRAGTTQSQSDVSAAAAEQIAAVAAVERATLSNKDRLDWANALNNPPLATIHTDAANALDASNPVDGAAFKQAGDRLKNDIPVKLFDRAEGRRAQAAALLGQADKNTKDAEDAVLKERSDHGGSAGAAAKLWVLFKRAEAAARDFVNAAKPGLDRAKTALAEVGNAGNSPLTTEQRERIQHAALKSDREAAADAEAALDGSLRKAVSDKQDALDAAILTAKADPTEANKQAVVTARGDLTAAQTAFDAAYETWDEKGASLAAATDAVDQKQAALEAAIQQAIADGNDPDTDPNVDLAKNDLTTARNNLKSAEIAYALDFWEAAIPDTTWRLFEKYEKAVETLNWLKSSNPATLKSNLKTAEESYVAAQLQADKSADVLRELAAEHSQRTSRQESARQAADARRFSALRGDE